jgi:hypothetical protein
MKFDVIKNWVREKFGNKLYDPMGDYWFNLLSLIIFLICGIFGFIFIFLQQKNKLKIKNIFLKSI